MRLNKVQESKNCKEITHIKTIKVGKILLHNNSLKTMSAISYSI